MVRDRILVSHTGNLPFPADFEAAWMQDDHAALQAMLPEAVAATVARQVELGIDIVNDGELPKAGSFVNYMHDRLSGFETRPVTEGSRPKRNPTGERDRREFPGVWESGLWFAGAAGKVRPGFMKPGAPPLWPGGRERFCAGPVRYTGQAAVQADIARLQAAMAPHPPAPSPQDVERGSIGERRPVQGCLTALGPLTLASGLRNEFYRSEEEYLIAMAEAVREEYRAIAAAGLIVQIDEPDFATTWQLYPEWEVSDYRRQLGRMAEVLNHALAGVPEEQVRLHFCWGSGHRPHTNDIELKYIADLALKVKACCYAIEAANVRHEHEYHVWEDVKLPEGKTLMPGVVTHATDLIEHPELVATRLVQYAERVGRENVQAGTDCGMGLRVGHAEIAWAKLATLVEGARLASERLWRE
jgi:5-methyltetrahydropteroyltriglutamate--homocysteine methyltransferase